MVRVKEEFVLELILEGTLKFSGCFEGTDGEIPEVIEIGSFLDILSSAWIIHHILFVIWNITTITTMNSTFYASGGFKCPNHARTASTYSPLHAVGSICKNAIILLL